MPESTDFLARAELKISPQLQFAAYPNSPLRSQSTAALYQCESDDESGVMKSSCSKVSTTLFVLWMLKTTQQRNNQQSLLLFAVHQQITL